MERDWKMEKKRRDTTSGWKVFWDRDVCSSVTLVGFCNLCVEAKITRLRLSTKVLEHEWISWQERQKTATGQLINLIGTDGPQ